MAPEPAGEVVATRDEPTVTYRFPVEVEVVGGVDEQLVTEIVTRVFTELDRELARRQ